MEYISYGKQCIEDDDIAAVVEALKSDYLTSGPRVAEFENDLAKIVGARYAVAVSNGTAALHIAALALGIGAGDEVITTPITFAASSNCALYCGATPVFADIDGDTMLLDIDKVREKITPTTKVIIPVHYGGELCNMDAFAELASEYNLAIIQDCAHSLGGKTCGKAQGEYPGMQIWSFHPVKTITTGEGGAVTTNDENLYKKLLRLRTHGITRDKNQLINDNAPWYYEMLDLGFNYRLTDIQCALGISQLKKLERFIKRRKEIVERYNDAFRDSPLKIQHTPKWSSPARHLYTIRLDEKHRRREVFNALLAKNIGVNVHYMPAYLMPYYKSIGYSPGICPIAEDSYERMITLPLHPLLTDEQVGYVIKCVKESFGKVVYSS
ncbi:MAG: UDP-4-amino-4,6-dideoxy-N-acetyl-beta-L-altrosamine transaminase [Defluviitaleaceae bacterium]|nr:UDP-4-amino-4,6-dideoxy-N-acetyl-beta-L-altrosamine transaminase [Defluviitaleaceae bacterium]